MFRPIVPGQLGDLRRAFGTRWARVLIPNQLQELMRRASISTTMTFYVEEPISDIEAATDRGFTQGASKSADPTASPFQPSQAGDQS